jgi:predicted ABC-type sugar transport system permease subunit
MALASLGGLETALREHFGGYASHALLLAALPAVLTAGVLFFAGAPWIAIPLAGALVLAVAWRALRRSFARHS